MEGRGVGPDFQKTNEICVQFYFLRHLFMARVILHFVPKILGGAVRLMFCGEKMRVNDQWSKGFAA